MWAVIKFDKKKFTLLKNDLSNKLGNDLKFYVPKISIKKFVNNKLKKKEINVLGDYMFCFHKRLSNKEFLKIINYSRGLKYILNGHREFQNEISDFVNKCRYAEDENGYLKQNFFDIDIRKTYKFISGPFTDKIFTIIKIQQSKIDILLGNLKTTVKKQEFLFNPI